MNIIIKRTEINETHIDGHLFINGQKICDTAEATTKRLKTGQYSIVLHKCPLVKKNYPMILPDSEDGNLTVTDRPCKLCCLMAEKKEALRLDMLKWLDTGIERGLSDEDQETLEVVLQKDLNEQLQSLDMSEICCPKLSDGNGTHHQPTGTINLGTSLVSGVLVNTSNSFESLNERIRKSLKRGKSINLIIQR